MRERRLVPRGSVAAGGASYLWVVELDYARDAKGEQHALAKAR